MITLTVTEDQAHMIRYALGELASRRQEQAIDSFSYKHADRHTALFTEAERLRALQRQVADTINETVSL